MSKYSSIRIIMIILGHTLKLIIFVQKPPCGRRGYAAGGERAGTAGFGPNPVETAVPEPVSGRRMRKNRFRFGWRATRFELPPGNMGSVHSWLKHRQSQVDETSSSHRCEYCLIASLAMRWLVLAVANPSYLKTISWSISLAKRGPSEFRDSRVCNLPRVPGPAGCRAL